jgi:tetratricopeptide (TPR) repeat protein
MTDRGKRPGLISDSFAAQSGTVNGSRNDFDESVLNCGFYANYCWRAGFSGNATDLGSGHRCARPIDGARAQHLSAGAMLKALTDLQAIEALAESDLREACERARALVAERPEDENSATLLRDVVQRFARAAPQQAAGPPPVAPAVAEARELMAAGKMEDAEIILRQHLQGTRHDPAAMHSMAEIAAACDLREDADRILRESARIHAGSAAAWVDLGMTIYRIALTKDYPDYVPRAVAALDEALMREPANETALSYKAAILAHTRGTDRALGCYQKLLSLNPQVSVHWLNYGYLLKTIGEFGRGLAAYRTALALERSNGAAWWGLANLKLAKFFESDIELMEGALDDASLPERNRVEISFALAKALDQAQEYSRAAQRLNEANALRNRSPTPEANVVGTGIEFIREVYTDEFFEQRRGWGDPRRDPIFIVGMPRAGSTLIEQILASHPMIEGTEELFVLHQLETELAREHPDSQPAELVRGLAHADCDRLGSRYIELAGRSRRTSRPMFTDKNPANWRYLGLIHCMLPNARIIDARRNPMDCCFANYAQHYQAGANFSYDQRALGRHYSDYVLAMRHFDRVLPGRIHRLIHDDLVDDFEAEVRRLLDYIGVPFDEACLRYYETERAVHTPSSEQVRQPINRSGFGKWRNYEPWLSDLKAALGETLDNWRE